LFHIAFSFIVSTIILIFDFFFILLLAIISVVWPIAIRSLGHLFLRDDVEFIESVSF